MGTHRHRRAAQAFAGLIGLAIAVWTLRVYLDFGPDALIRDGLYDAAALACALLVAWRAVVVREDRAAWLLAALGLACWWAGDLWWIVHAEDNEVPIPSLADACYLGMYLPLGAAVVLLVRRRAGHGSGMLALDGLIGACAIASLSAAVVIEPVLDHAEGSTAALLVTLAYPVCDVVLLGVVVEAVALAGWRLPRAWALLTAGLAAFALTDGLYYVLVAQGSYEAYGLLDSGWLVAMLLVAVAAWQPPPRAVRAQELGWRHLAAPGVFAVLALGVTVYAYAQRVNVGAMALACAGLVGVIVRMVATFRENLRILREARHEAVTDSLTGLGNRRLLLADLDLRLAQGGGHRLVLCDLNGFKLYNDSFGHPAGDALLSRLGAKLAWAVAGRGDAYRMGGDEFCVLLDDSLPAEDVLELVGAALSERGEGFFITASSGSTTLPGEAATAAESLRLADARMYEHKREGRARRESRGVDLLLRLQSERSPDLLEHVNGLADLAAAVARRLGLADAQCEEIRMAAALHDVGKLAIPDSILDKPGPLDDDEWAFMHRHTLIGARILGTAPDLAGVARIVRASHERPDGRGYPEGLRGEDVPLGARIIAVCDAYDAMVTDRPYRRALTRACAMAELRKETGRQFDAGVVDAFAAELAVARRPVAA